MPAVPAHRPPSTSSGHPRLLTVAVAGHSNSRSSDAQRLKPGARSSTDPRHRGRNDSVMSPSVSRSTLGASRNAETMQDHRSTALLTGRSLEVSRSRPALSIVFHAPVVPVPFRGVLGIRGCRRAVMAGLTPRERARPWPLPRARPGIRDAQQHAEGQYRVDSMSRERLTANHLNSSSCRAGPSARVSDRAA